MAQRETMYYRYEEYPAFKRGVLQAAASYFEDLAELRDVMLRDPEQQAFAESCVTYLSEVYLQYFYRIVDPIDPDLDKTRIAKPGSDVEYPIKRKHNEHLPPSRHQGSLPEEISVNEAIHNLGLPYRAPDALKLNQFFERNGLSDDSHWIRGIYSAANNYQDLPGSLQGEANRFLDNLFEALQNTPIAHAPQYLGDPIDPNALCGMIHAIGIYAAHGDLGITDLMIRSSDKRGEIAWSTGFKLDESCPYYGSALEWLEYFNKEELDPLELRPIIDKTIRGFQQRNPELAGHAAAVRIAQPIRHC